MFLASLQDEVERSHRRQAFWMSILLHLVALAAFIDGAKLFPANKILGPADTAILQNREYTFLVLPPDLQKNAPAPHTDVLSDKNRVATSHRPVVNRKAPQHVLNAGRETAAGKLVAPPPKVLLAHNLARPLARPAEEATPALPPVSIRTGQPEMTAVPAVAPPPASPATTKIPPSVATSGLMGSSSGHGGAGASEALNVAGAPPASQSNVDVLSDTMGVNFGPYLSRVLHAVRANWYSRIPESARAPLMKRGKVSVQFDILKTGQIAGMQVVGSSGDPSLDGAAIIGISGSGPFPPLPSQFQGQYLALRFHFFYNPDGNDLR